MTAISCEPGVTYSPEEIAAAPLVHDWLARCQPGWEVEQLRVYAAHFWNGAIRMVYADITAVDPEGRRQTVNGFLRGQTVDILAVLRDEDQQFVVLVEQPRVPVGQMVLSNPSGMVDDGDVESTALQELTQELGENVVSWSRPVWLSEPLLVTPGGSDEEVRFCFVSAELSSEDIQALHGRMAGLEAEGERTRLHVVPLSEARTYLHHYGRADLKTVTSLLLYDRYRQS